MNPTRKVAFGLLLALSYFASLGNSALQAQTLYVGTSGANAGVQEFDISTGTLINADFIPVTNGALSLALTGNVLYVGRSDGIGTYNATTGAAINPNLIGGVVPASMVISGNTLYVSSGGTVGTYNASTGAAINANFITGLDQSAGQLENMLALSGNNLFVGNPGSHFTDPNTPDEVGEYDATTGARTNVNLTTSIGASSGAVYLLVSGNNIYVSSEPARVDEYNITTGELLPFGTSGLNGGTELPLALSGNTLFVGETGGVQELDAATGNSLGVDLTAAGNPTDTFALAVSVPEPGSGILLAMGALSVACRRKRSRG